MIKLIAAIFLIVGGVQESAPVQQFTYTVPFENIAECEAARASEQLRIEVLALDLLLRREHPGVEFVIETRCE